MRIGLKNNSAKRSQSKNAQRSIIPLLIGLLSLPLLSALSGCSSLKFPGVFKIDVGQGNIINKEMIEKLKPGMTKRQVRYVMGSPLLTDTFHEDRWDYYFSIMVGDQRIVKRHISLHFEHGQFTRAEGDIDDLLAKTETIRSLKKTQKNTQSKANNNSVTPSNGEQPTTAKTSDDSDTSNETTQE